MQDHEKTKDQLVAELRDMRRRLAQLEETEARLLGTEKVLLESEERFRLLYEHAPLGYQSLNEDGYFLEVNRAWLNTLGYSREEVIGKWFGDFLALGYRDHFKVNFPKFKAAGETHDVEFDMVKKDGSIISVSFDGKIGRDQYGGFKQTHCILQDMTERRRAEEALLKSEQMLSTILSASPVAIAFSGADRKMIWANNSAYKMFGLSTAEQLTGRPISSFYASREEFDRVTQSLYGRVATERVIETDVKLMRTDGTIFDGYIRIQTVEPSNLSQGIIAIIEDVTDIRRAEEALCESQQKYRMIFKHAPLGILHFDEKGVMLDFNDKFVEMIGATRGALIGFNMPERQKDELMRRAVLDALAGKISYYEGDYLSVTAGKLTPMRVVYGPVVADDGRLLGGIGIFEDITERKRTEDALEKSEMFLQQIVENIPDMIFVKEAENLTFVRFNRAGEELLGYSRKDLLGKNDYDFFPQNQADFFTAKDREVLAAGKLVEILQEEIDTKVKGKRILHTKKIPVKDANGNPQFLLGISEDITHRKQAERDRDNLRTQLLQSQKMEAVGTLATGIAHDFNNMLQVILGYSDMLIMDKEMGDPGYHELQTIIKTTHEARDLVQKIRVFSRKADMNLVPMDLNHQIAEVTKLLSHTLPKMINIEVRLAESPAIIKADTALMDQMVMNLAINASEAMPDGGILTIETQNISLDDDFCSSHVGVKPGPHVMLTVFDTGRGMSKELLEKIFDPFFSTKQRDCRRGTGLGLSVVQGIVEQHGGHVTCESEVGKGTSFRIYFPVLIAEEAAKVVTPVAFPTGGNETVLLVEDEEAVRELGVKILEKFGYRVLSVGDGQQALEVYGKEQENISLVILDIIMPRMDGKQCLQELRKMNPSVKVLISTGLAQDDLIQDVVALGARGAVRKPYNMRGLLEKVREVIDSEV